jgi:hypothetical protein
MLQQRSVLMRAWGWWLSIGDTIRIRARFIQAGGSITAAHPHHAKKEAYRRVALSASSCGRGGRVGHAEAIGGFAGRRVSEESKMRGANAKPAISPASPPAPANQRLRPAASTTTAPCFGHPRARTWAEMASSSTATLSVYYHYCRSLDVLPRCWMLANRASTRLATASRHCCPAVAV